METGTTIKESGIAGQPGETTAVASSAAKEARTESKNLTPDGVASLLNSAFAEPESPATPATPKAEGEEVQPDAATGEADVSTEDNPETPADPENPETPTEGQLPAHLEAELQQWEQSGGTLPASLQKLVEKRIGKVVGEREQAEQRAAKAEADAEALRGELAAKPQSAPASVTDEQKFTAQMEASKKFLKDARPFVGGYATDEQKQRMEKFMEANGLNDNSLRQQMDGVADWLTVEAPQAQMRIQQFKQAEQAAEPLMAARFGSLAKKDGLEAKAANELASLLPELKSRTPGHKLAVATFVLGKIAAEHLLAASKEGDVIEALKSVLTRHAPLPVNGAKANGNHTNGNGNGALPGKAPIKTPTGSPVAGTRTATGRAGELDQASQKLTENPTVDNVMQSLKIALR